MSHTQQFDITTPANSDLMGKYAEFMREYKQDLEERVVLDHYWDSSLDTTLPEADGYHRQVNLKSLTLDPSAMSGAGVVYDFVSGGVQRLKYGNGTAYNITGDISMYVADFSTAFSGSSGSSADPYSLVDADSYTYVTPILVNGAAEISGSDISLPTGEKIITVVAGQRCRVAAELFSDISESWLDCYVYDGVHYGSGQANAYGAISGSSIKIKNNDSGAETNLSGNYLHTSASNIRIGIKCDTKTWSCNSAGRDPKKWRWTGTYYKINIMVAIKLL